MDVLLGHHVVRLTIDSGATENVVRHSTAQRLRAPITFTSQSVYQADGFSPLQFIGETRLRFLRDSREFVFEGLIVENLDVDVLAGTPVMEVNDIAVRPAKREIIIGEGQTYRYGSTTNLGSPTAARRAFLLRAPAPSTTIWPVDFLEMQLPSEASPDGEYALESRIDAPHARGLKSSQLWPPPSIIPSVARTIHIPNLSNQPQSLKRNEHFCQLTPVFEPEADTVTTASSSERSVQSPTNHMRSALVQFDPTNLLPSDIKAKFASIHREYDSVFDPALKGYNGAARQFQARVNIGPVDPPQRKGRLPQYSRGKLAELQDKFDN